MRETPVDARKICGDPKFRAKRPRPTRVEDAFEAWQKCFDTYAGQILRRIGLARRTDQAAQLLSEKRLVAFAVTDRLPSHFGHIGGRIEKCTGRRVLIGFPVTPALCVSQERRPFAGLEILRDGITKPRDNRVYTVASVALRIGVSRR